MSPIYLFYIFSPDNLDRPWYNKNSTPEENNRARRAYESVLTVTATPSSNSPEYESFSKQVKELSREKFDYSYDEPVNNFVANFHDAVRKRNLIILTFNIKSEACYISCMPNFEFLVAI